MKHHPDPSDCRRLISKFQDKAPIDVEALASEMALKIRRVIWPDHPWISGQIKFNSETLRYEIFVNHEHHKNRQRFTIAHEIAHFVLHRPAIGTGLQHNGLMRSDIGGFRDYREREANRMAADILMPEHLIDVELSKMSEHPRPDAIGQLASKFSISPSAMSIQIGAPFED